MKKKKKKKFPFHPAFLNLFLFSQHVFDLAVFFSLSLRRENFPLSIYLAILSLGCLPIYRPPICREREREKCMSLCIVCFSYRWLCVCLARMCLCFFSFFPSVCSSPSRDTAALPAAERFRQIEKDRLSKTKSCETPREEQTALRRERSSSDVETCFWSRRSKQEELGEERQQNE